MRCEWLQPESVDLLKCLYKLQAKGFKVHPPSALRLTDWPRPTTAPIVYFSDVWKVNSVQGRVQKQTEGSFHQPSLARCRPDGQILGEKTVFAGLSFQVVTFKHRK